MRTIIIGDIHGCSRSLQALTERVSPRAGKDRLVLLGDLFDRGPDSYGVLQMTMKMADEFGSDFILLTGNHEDYLLQPKLTKLQKTIWEQVGRRATVKSFRKSGSRMEEAVPWLKEHVRLYWKTELFQCVHAGLKVDPPEVNDQETLIHSHETVMMNRYAGPLTITGHISLNNATWFTGDGETTEELPEGVSLILPRTGIICIDTGCGKGGRLTAMVTEEKRYTLYSVPES